MTLIDRLSNKLLEIEGGCWIFTGSRDEKGYGLIGYNGVLIRTHRASWIATHGKIPDDLWVLHRCDNPPCCNPDHLFLGTCQDNVNDMIAKGRHVAPVGTNNGRVRLSEENVLLIRDALNQGATCNELSLRFNVHANTIDAIRHRRSWRHL